MNKCIILFEMATASGSKNQYFSIDDAFEEETDEAIKIYGLSNSRLQSCESISNAERGFCNTNRLVVNILLYLIWYFIHTWFFNIAEALNMLQMMQHPKIVIH